MNKTNSVPVNYEQEAEQQGEVVRIDYDTRDYAEGTGVARTNTAYVYLPYGYDEHSDRRYNVLYFVHGHYGTVATTFEAENGLVRKLLDPWRNTSIMHCRFFPERAEYLQASDYCQHRERCDSFTTSIPMKTSGRMHARTIRDFFPFVESRANRLSSFVPAVVIMGYTGHSEYTPDDPPTYVIIGEDDAIASPSTMRRRVENLQGVGIDAEFHLLPDLRHGFGLGRGTTADGWHEDAVRFWEKYISRKNGTSYRK